MLKLNDDIVYDKRQNVIFISLNGEGYKLEDTVSIFIFDQLIKVKKIKKAFLINDVLNLFSCNNYNDDQIELETELFINELITSGILVSEYDS